MLSGKYGIKEIDLATGKTLRTLLEPTSNLIVDNGYRMLQTYNPVAAVFRLGVGKTAPTMSDTTLESEIAATTTPLTYEDLDLVTTGSGDNATYSGAMKLTATYMVPEDMVVYEIGIGPEETNEVFSRALVGSGVQLHANSALRLTYTLTCTIKALVESQAVFSIDGQDYPVTRKVNISTGVAKALPRLALCSGYFTPAGSNLNIYSQFKNLNDGSTIYSTNVFTVSVGEYEDRTLVYDLNLRLDRWPNNPKNTMAKCTALIPIRTSPRVLFDVIEGQEPQFNTSVEYPIKLKIPFK